MTYRPMRTLLFCGALLGLAACSDDPAAVGSGDIIDIASDKALIIVSPGDSVNLAAWAVDATNSRVAQQITFTSTSGTATVGAGTYFPELAETRTGIKIAANATAGSAIIMSAGTLADTVHIVVATPGTSGGAPALIFRSPIGVFTEDIEVEVAGGAAVILSRTPTELAVLLPFGAEGATAYTFTNFGNDQSIEVSGDVMVAGAPLQEAGEPNDTRATAIPAALETDIYGALTDEDTDDYYAFTITEAGQYEFAVDWNDASDVDLLPRSSTGSVLSGGAATSAQPEHATVTLQPGTYYAQVNMYAWDPVLPATTYTLHVTRIQ
jgi:hypothetical protein